MSARRKVCVLGGGCAGTAAALALSATPALRERFEVTVVERTWRLGGKGATGRDPSRGWRIEEHGLHVWMGFYERTFAAIRGALDELGTDASLRLRHFEDAFTPRFAFSVYDADAQKPWTLRLPSRPGLPGDGGPLPRFGPADVARFVRAFGRTCGSSEGVRMLVRLVALGAVAGRGALASMLQRQSLDDYDLREWLRKHGASEAVALAPVVRAFYDMTFAYPDGVSGPNRGAVAAGAALGSMLRILFTYRGAPFWLLRHGMGDTAFAPAYRVLRRRGVRFAWMHDVRRLNPGSSGAVETVELSAASLPEHPMLLEHDGLQVWPNAPRVRPSPPSSVCLRRGEDFDSLILAIPIPALHGPLAPMAAIHPHVCHALDSSASVATRAAQLWVRDAPRIDGITTGFGGGYPTFADLSGVLASEGWGADAPKGLLYLVDTTPDDDPRAAEEAASRWVGNVRGTREVSRYVRVNSHPADRYVLTLPGSVEHRLPPDDIRIENLRFAGDWTATSINGGSVEAAFESGERAAASL